MPKKKKRKASGPRICNRCGKESDKSATKCEHCSSTKFAPEWVSAKRPVNRQVSVEITTSNPEYGDPEKRITLSKWWPGGRSNFHIPSVKQWEAIEQIIDGELGPLLGWKTKEELVERIRENKGKAKSTSADVQKLATEYPEVIRQMVRSIDPEKIKGKDIGDLTDMMGQLVDAMGEAEAGFKESFLSLVKKLPKQGKRAIEDLEKLLEDWSLHQINSVTKEVQSRVQTIELFKKQVLDERTYEIRGVNSIHRILERAMWLIDERYWLLQSNETLRTHIGEEMSKRDKKQYGKKRPDFVCGTVDSKLIIVELKRPSHTLKIADINQLETYLTLAKKYGSAKSYEAYLVGTKKDAELTDRMQFRDSRTFKIFTFSDLIEDTERRYAEFLKAAKGGR